MLKCFYLRQDWITLISALPLLCVFVTMVMVLQLIQALVASGNSVILDVMVGIICQDPCQLHVCEEQIQLAFNNFITRSVVSVYGVCLYMHACVYVCKHRCSNQGVGGRTIFFRYSNRTVTNSNGVKSGQRSSDITELFMLWSDDSLLCSTIRLAD